MSPLKLTTAGASRPSAARTRLAAATDAMATARPDMEPLLSMSRHNARRCACQERVTRSSAPGRPDPRPLVEGPVQVEVALGPAGAETAGAPGGLVAGARQPDEDPRGQPPGRGAQLTVGGAGQLGQEGHGSIRVGGQQPGERLLVEPAQLG